MSFNLQPSDVSAISVLLLLLLGGLCLLLIDALSEKISNKYSFYITLSILVLCFFDTYFTHKSSNQLIADWIELDTLSKTLTYFFIAIGIGITLLSKSFFQRFHVSHGEFYFFLLSSLFGLILIGSSADFLTLFLGLETLSIALYILCTYVKKWKVSHEAAIKYFFMGSIGAALLLYGTALVYGAIGTTKFNQMLEEYRQIDQLPDQILFHVGITFITVGFLFKAAIFPFHVWAPDVYSGAPTPVTAFMSVGTKVGAFAAFARVFLVVLPDWNPVWNQGIALLSMMTLLYANSVALQQTQLRRFFAYSGISHAGFALIALAVGTSDAIHALLFYLAIYSLATLGAFAVISYLDDKNGETFLNDLSGLFYRSPALATIFSICILTLAGIPPTVGFLGKFYLFKIAYEAKYYGLIVVALFSTILSAYYYLRLVMTMLHGSDQEIKQRVHAPAIFVLGSVCILGILWFSIDPEALFKLVS